MILIINDDSSWCCFCPFPRRTERLLSPALTALSPSTCSQLLLQPWCRAGTCWSRWSSWRSPTRCTSLLLPGSPRQGALLPWVVLVKFLAWSTVIWLVLFSDMKEIAFVHISDLVLEAKGGCAVVEVHVHLLSLEKIWMTLQKGRKY